MKKGILVGLGVLVMVGFGAVTGFSWTMPDTGQTTCYDTDGNVIDCQGTGQDGEFTINPHSYESITIGGDKMVRDNVTGLIWEVKTDDGSMHDKDNTYDWYDANDVFIAQLNDDVFGGYSDWRLPTIKELSSLRDLERYDPAIDTEYFLNTVSYGRYWSSSSFANYPSEAWDVHFLYGFVGSSDKSYSLYRYVRAVRAGQ